VSAPTPPPDLLDPNDFAKFKAKDETWFLGVAGDAIRNECGWHISPVISETDVIAEIGSAGLVVLPTLNIVSVEAVRLNGRVLVENSEYIVHDSGWLELVGWCLSSGSGFVSQRGYQRAVTPSQTWRVAVDYTHGYETLPRAVSEVGFEVASATMEKPAGAVSDLTAGPYRFKFNDCLGANLSDEQKSRLGPDSLVRV
jgi:hypothetical protein